MPIIHLVRGIYIKMYLREKEHNPPHVHAVYGGYSASFVIETGKILDGKFPYKQRNKVKRFLLKHRTELLDMWESGNYHKIEGEN